MAQITVTIIATDAADLQDTLRRMVSSTDAPTRVRGYSTDNALAAAETQRAKSTTSETGEAQAVRRTKGGSGAKVETPALEPTTPEPTTETLAISTGEARVDPAQEALAAQEEGATADGPETYDYNTVVMPLVLEVMGLVNDREFIMGKIREYGGENAVKASEIPDDRMAAFVADMRAVRDAKTAKS